MDIFSYRIYPTSTVRSVIDFSDYDNDIPAAFSLLTAEMCRLFKKADFYILKRAMLQQKYIPGGVQFSDDLYIPQHQAESKA